MEPKTLLDTDVLSGLIRKNPTALNRARTYLADHQQFTISLVTRFEILRGLKAKRATAQLAAFDRILRKQRGAGPGGPNQRAAYHPLGHRRADRPAVPIEFGSREVNRNPALLSPRTPP
jgi:hypothetical protein